MLFVIFIIVPFQGKKTKDEVSYICLQDDTKKDVKSFPVDKVELRLKTAEDFRARIVPRSKCYIIIRENKVLWVLRAPKTKHTYHQI